MPPAAHRANRDAAGKRPVSPPPPPAGTPPPRGWSPLHIAGEPRREGSVPDLQQQAPFVGSAQVAGHFHPSNDHFRPSRRVRVSAGFSPDPVGVVPHRLPERSGRYPLRDPDLPHGQRPEHRRCPAVMVLVRGGKDKHVDPAGSPAPDVGKNDLFSRVPAQAAPAIDEHVPSSRKGNHVSRPSPDIQRSDPASSAG